MIINIPGGLLPRHRGVLLAGHLGGSNKGGIHDRKAHPLPCHAFWCAKGHKVSPWEQSWLSESHAWPKYD